ncbi:DUF3307 domain-containing protein [Devosia sp.]|uniref:DUF3307 domain-containing protein n=1 Tax=Devosia sp. TaxID=1871048 RepID=UPI003BA88D5D
MFGLFFVLLVGLELKHCVADYFLQPGWIIAGKGDLRKPGGYAHAGIHAAMTGVLLLVTATPLMTALLLVLAEFVVHYALDYSKIQYSRGVHAETSPGRFWALHGIDQFAHQLTYAAIICVAMSSRGFS